MALTVGELVAYAKIDRTDFTRGTRSIAADMRSLQTSTTGAMVSLESAVSRTSDDIARELGDAFDPTQPLADVQRLTAGVVSELSTAKVPAGRAGRAAGTEFVDEAREALRMLKYGEFDVDIDANMHIAAAMAELARIDAEIDRLDGRTIDIDMDVDTTPAMDGLGTLVKGAGQAGDAMGGAMGVIGKSGAANVAIVAAAIAVLPTVASIAASGIVAALGGGLLAVGFTAAASADDVKHAWKAAVDEIKKEMADAAEPLEGSAIRAAAVAERAFDRLKPSLSRIFTDLVPDVDHFIEMVGRGVGSLGPTLERLGDSFGDVLSELGDRMPAIIDNLGETIDTFSAMMDDDPEMLANLVEDATELLAVGAELMAWAENLKLLMGPSAAQNQIWEMMFGVTYDEFMEQSQAMPQTMADLRTSLEAAATAATNVGGAGDDAATGVRNLNDALKEMFDPAAAALGAEIRLKEALKEVAEAAKDGKMTDLERLRSVQDLTGAIAEAASAEHERTGKTTKATEAFGNQLPRLLELAEKNDAAKAAVAGLGASLGATVKKTDDGKIAIDKFGKAVVTLPNGKTVKVDADTAKALSGLADTKKKTEELKNKTVQVDADTKQAVTEVGKVAKGLGGLKGAGQQAGKDLGSGLTAGIKSMIGEAAAAARSLAQSALNAAKDLLGIKSPSTAMAEVGKWTVKGLILGLQSEEGNVKTTIENLVKQVKEAFGSQPDVADHLLDFIKLGNQNLEDLALQREALVQRLADAKEYAKSVAGDAKEWASIMGMSKEEIEAGDISGSLRDRAQSIKDFANDIKRLAQSGLNKTTLRQIIDAGVEKGSTIADMLVGADGSEIKAINKAQKQIDNMSKQLGKSGADALFDVGKKAGDGYLKGLQESLKALDKEMQKIVQALVKAIKKELKIKSPSQVMAEVGVQTMAGLAEGIVSGGAQALGAIAGVASGLVDKAAGSLGGMLPGSLAPTGGGPTSSSSTAFDSSSVHSSGSAGVPGAGGGVHVAIDMSGSTIKEATDIPKLGSAIGFQFMARGAV